MTEDEKATVLELIDLDELRACTTESLEEAAFALKLSIRAAEIHEPTNAMATERELLNHIQLVLRERHLSEPQKEETSLWKKILSRFWFS